MTIQMTATDFFNAYLVLQENNEALIERQANSSAMLLEGTKMPGTLSTMGVEIVCLAFSVELYIKDLHCAIEGKAPRGHNILKLFEKLPEQIQQDIFAYDSISQNPYFTRGDLFSTKRFNADYSAYDGFIDQVKAISDGFEKWRYSYESTSLRYDTSFAIALIESIKSAASQVRKKSTERND